MIPDKILLSKNSGIFNIFPIFLDKTVTNQNKRHKKSMNMSKTVTEEVKLQLKYVKVC